MGHVTPAVRRLQTAIKQHLCTLKTCQCYERQRKAEEQFYMKENQINMTTKGNAWSWIGCWIANFVVVVKVHY